jgi:hypothetical protein
MNIMISFNDLLIIDILILLLIFPNAEVSETTAGAQ